jgi:hypothetical protein
LLLYVVEQLGEVSVTKLQKVLYLSDLEHHHRFGTTLSGARWVRYTHGPMAKALLPSTREMDGHELAVTVEPNGSYEARIYRPGPDPRFSPDLSEEECDVVDQIIAVTRHLSAGDAIRVAYNTAPMRFIQSMERVQGNLLLDVELPFDLADDVIAAVSGSEEAASPEARAAFKKSEWARIADLQRWDLRTA